MSVKSACLKCGALLLLIFPVGQVFNLSVNLAATQPVLNSKDPVTPDHAAQMAKGLDPVPSFSPTNRESSS